MNAYFLNVRIADRFTLILVLANIINFINEKKRKKYIFFLSIINSPRAVLERK